MEGSLGIRGPSSNLRMTLQRQSGAFRVGLGGAQAWLLESGREADGAKDNSTSDDQPRRKRRGAEESYLRKNKDQATI